MALVIFMGVLILIGLVLLAYGVYREMGAEAPAPSVAEAPPEPSQTQTPPDRASVNSRLIQERMLPAPFTATLDMPAGAVIKSVGDAAGRLAVVVTLPGGEERILLLDPANGNLLGTIAVGGR